MHQISTPRSGVRIALMLLMFAASLTLASCTDNRSPLTCTMPEAPPLAGTAPPSITAAAGIAYFQGGNILYAFEASSGKQLWRFTKRF